MMGINLRKSEKLPSKLFLPYKWLKGLSLFPFHTFPNGEKVPIF